MKVQNNLETILFNEEMGFLNLFKPKTTSLEDAKNHLGEIDGTKIKIIEKQIEEIIKKNPELTEEEIKRIILSEQNKIINENKINKSRRNFLKGLGIGSVLLTTAPNELISVINNYFDTNLVKSGELEARSIEYPPGIANCRDPAVKMAYYYYVRFGKRNYANRFYTGFELAQSLLRDRNIGDTHYSSFAAIRPDTPFIEPAYWFVCAKINIGPDWSIYPRLKKENPALYWFNEGIADYFQQWILHKGYTSLKKIIETDFLKSIFYAANYNTNEVGSLVKDYLNSKENYTRELKEIFNKYKPNWDEMDNKMRNFLINNSKKGKIMNKVMNRLLNEKDYNKRLVAQWSGFILSVHYGRTNEYNKDMTINKFIEKPLRKIDPRIRGPPFFKL